MPIIGKHHVHPYSKPGLSRTVAGEPQGEDAATVLLINTYRTPVSGVFRRKDFWFRGLWRKPGQRFAVCGGDPAWRQWRWAGKMDRGRLPLATRLLAWVRNAFTLVTCRRKWSVPDARRLRVVVRELVPVPPHRPHPHGAERGNHRDIHADPHGPIPRFTQWENCVSLPGVPEGAEILRVWLSGNESARSFCPTSLSSLPKAS